MYSLSGHGKMLADGTRMHAYTEALRRSVKPGSVVLDLGTGTGVFAALAVQLGARRVFAVEPGDIIEVARAVADANGCSGKIDFIQALSTDVTLPERADVIVSDLRGILPLFRRHIPDIIDARTRLLADDGQLIAHSDTLWAAVVEHPDFYHGLTSVWESEACGIRLEPARRLVTNSWYKTHASPAQLLVEPLQWAAIVYGAVDNPGAGAELRWEVRRAGTGHGLLLWFDSLLAHGVSLTNAPGRGGSIYGNAFLPWTKPVDLSAGDCVCVSLRARLVGDDYVWVWETSIQGGGPGCPARETFRQSTFYGELLSPARLRRTGA